MRPFSKMMAGSCRVLLVGMLLWQPMASAAPELLLDPWRSPEVCRALSARPVVRAVFGRVHVVAYASGRTLAATRQPDMSQPGEARALWAALSNARSQSLVGMPINLAAEPLTWRLPLRPDAWPTKADLESNAVGEAGAWLGEPWYLAVRRSSNRARLKALLEELAQASRPGDGLTVGLRLSSHEVLGYCDEDRRAWASTCPIELEEAGRPEIVGQFALWREATVTQLLSELLALPAKPLALPVTAIGTGRLPICQPGTRARSADNWLAWLEQGSVHEVLLDEVWEPTRTGRIWGTLTQLSRAAMHRTGHSYLGNAQKPVARLRPMIGYTTDPDGPDLLTQYNTLKAEGPPVDQACFCPNTVAELDQVLALLDREAKAAKPAPKGNKP